jgi:ubiquinone biosynthesis protein
MTTVITAVLAVVYAWLVMLVTRRLLGSQVGRIRAAAVGLAVFFASVAFSESTARAAGVSDGSGLRVSIPVALAFFALAFGWVLAVGIAVLVFLEAVWPSHRFSNLVLTYRSLQRRRRRTRRYLQILRIGSRHGLDQVLHGRGDGELSAPEQRSAAIVQAVNEAGVTFVKLGQLISTRRDLVPEPYLSGLASLQTQAAVVPWEDIRGVVERELGRPLEAVFAEVDRIPLAAASVAQVHTGRLLDGTPVVLKVQRPAARAQVEADVDIVLRVARRLERRTSWGRDFGAVALAQGFTTSLREELDYRVEAGNMDMLATAQRRSGAGVTVPAVFPEASGRRLLTMERIDGTPLSSAGPVLAALAADRRSAMADELLRTVLDQVLVHGVFHADLHPGNVLVRPDGTLGLIDFGAVGVMERSLREVVAGLLLAMGQEDDIAATDLLLLAVDAPEDTDVEAFRRAVGSVLTTVSLRSGDGVSVFSAMLDVIRVHRLGVPPALALALRALLTLEGCLRLVAPGYSFVQGALELVPGVFRERLDPKQLAARLPTQVAVLHAMARRAPGQGQSFVDQLLTSRLGLRVHTFSEERERRWAGALVAETIGAALAVGLLLVAAVLAGSETGPAFTPQVSALSFIGATVGLLGFLLLLRSIRRILEHVGR